MVTPVLIKQVTEPLGGSEKIEKEQFEWVLDSLESGAWWMLQGRSPVKQFIFHSLPGGGCHLPMMEIGS